VFVGTAAAGILGCDGSAFACTAVIIPDTRDTTTIPAIAAYSLLNDERSDTECLPLGFKKI